MIPSFSSSLTEPTTCTFLSFHIYCVKPPPYRDSCIHLSDSLTLILSRCSTQAHRRHTALRSGWLFFWRPHRCRDSSNCCSTLIASRPQPRPNPDARPWQANHCCRPVPSDQSAPAHSSHHVRADCAGSIKYCQVDCRNQQPRPDSAPARITTPFRAKARRS